MSRNFFTLLVVIILAAGGTWFWWNSRPEQQIGRMADDFQETVRFEKLSLKQKETRHAVFEKIFAEEVSFKGPFPLPDGEISRETIISRLDELHSMVTFFDIEELDRTIQVTGSTGTVTLDIRAKAAAGPQFKKEERWLLTLKVEKQDRWRITGFSGQRKN